MRLSLLPNTLTVLSQGNVPRTDWVGSYASSRFDLEVLEKNYIFLTTSGYRPHDLSVAQPKA